MNVKIPFDPSWKSVAISLSGGADSALLTYLICQKIEEYQLSNFTIHIINNIRCWKTKPWQQQDIKNVYNWLKNKFPKIYFELHTNFVPPELEWGDKGRTLVDEYGKSVSGDTLELRAFAEYVCYHADVNAYFNGVTRNPKDVDFQGMPTRDIDPVENNKHLEIMTHMGKLACHPFRFVDKSWIMLKYKELGLESLLDITRSCEGVFDGLDYKNYVPGQEVPTCGECFWCKERKWANEQSK
jgi:7-cyano-7-deazaguanine synthase in queuosine biosynthesis